MTIIRGCCPNQCASCNYQDLCRQDEDQYFAQYISIGRPRQPTEYPGKFWAAWHNSMHPTKSEIKVDISLNFTKRTLVQEGCAPGTCAAVGNGLATGTNCAANGSIVADSGCKRTVYADQYKWDYKGIKLPLLGLAPGQAVTELDENGEQIAENIGGHIPCGISLGCPSNTCTGSLSEAINSPKNPLWIANENRKVVTRFGSDNFEVDYTPTVYDNASYVQDANCDAIKRVNRCGESPVSSKQSVCIDYPIVILPSIGGYTNCAEDATPCDRTTPENGCDEALFGFDIINDELYDSLDTMGLADGQHIGLWDDFWVCKTNGRIRFLFAASQLLVEGDVLKFGNGGAGALNGIGGTYLATIRFGDVSWTCSLVLDIVPGNWGFVGTDCQCGQNSWCEHHTSVLHLEMDLLVDDLHLCIQDPAANIKTSVNVGLETCYRPLMTSGWNPCYMWDDLPGVVYAGAPSSIMATYRYLGEEPVERGHPYWVPYRQRYNNTESVNNWWFQGVPPGDTLCAASRSGAAVPIGAVEAYVGYHEAYVADDHECEAQCPGWCCACAFPADAPGGVGYQWATPECYPTRLVGSYNECNLAGPPPVVACSTVCSGCPNNAGTNPAGCGLNGCVRMSVPTIADYPCQAFFGCAPPGQSSNFNYTMIIHVCGGGNYNVCGLVAPSGSAPHNVTIGFPDTFIAIDWHPDYEFGPIRTHKLKVSSDGLVCDGPSGWSANTYALEVT